MPDDPCPTCGSTLGYYDGPNGVPRCLNCFADAEIRTEEENPSPEPNAGGTSVAKASAQEKPDKADKQVKPVQVMTTSGTRPVDDDVPVTQEQAKRVEAKVAEAKKEPAVTQREAQEQAKAEAAQVKKEPAAKPATGKKK